MLLAAVGLGAVGVVQMSIEPRADAEPITVGTISAQMADQEGVTDTGDPDGTTESNCILYSPPNTANSSEFVTSPGEALTSHGRSGESCPESPDTGQQSALGIAPVAGSSVVNGDPFLLAEITHYNWSVEGSGAARYRGETKLAFGDFDGDPVVTMSWEMWETPDSPKPCPFGGGPGGHCRDQVTFDIPAEGISMSRGGLGYRLTMGDLVPVEGEEACPVTPVVAAGISAFAEVVTPNSLAAQEEGAARGCLYGTISQGRLVTVVKSIDGVETDVVAPSATFDLTSTSDLPESPWNTSFELTPPADGSDSSDAAILLASESVTITEDASTDPRWELTDIQCVDFDANGDPRPLPSGATYDVENRQLVLSQIPEADYEDDGSITCTFVNVYTPMTTITLVKEVVDGEASPEDFTLTATPTEGDPISGVSGSVDVTERMVPAGDYVLSETGPSGYLSPDGWECVGATMVGNTVTVVDGADVVCTIANEVERVEISLGKVPSRTFFSASGQVITYTYTITNSGNQILGPGQFTVTDDRIDAGVPFPCGASDVTLDPDETVTCTRDYTATTDDVTAGEITNEAVASLGELDSEMATATVDYAVLLITKTPSRTEVTAAGQVITYTYTVINNGLESLGPDQFTVSDNRINAGLPFNCGPAATTLAVAGSISCTATYTVTSADITAGSITNTASASGARVTSPTVTVTVDVDLPTRRPGRPAATTTPVQPAEVPSIRLTKSASPAFYFLAGDVITYTYTVTNDGTKALGPFQFTVTDNRINGGLAFNCGAANTTLAAKATLSCTATYTITAVDVAAGSVTNSAFASAGTAVSNTVTATVTGEKILFPSELPVTGSTSDGPSLAALVSLGIGLGLVVLVRRRRMT